MSYSKVYTGFLTPEPVRIDTFGGKPAGEPISTPYQPIQFDIYRRPSNSLNGPTFDVNIYDCNGSRTTQVQHIEKKNITDYINIK